MKQMSKQVNFSESPTFFSTAAPESSDLDIKEIHHIGMQHKHSNRGRIVHAMAKYIDFMNNKNHPTSEKLEKMWETQELLQQHINEAENKVFGYTVMRMLHLNIHKKLQSLLPSPDIALRVHEAFEAMIEVDKEAEFNGVVQAALTQNKLNSEAFVTFLNDCIQEGATNNGPKFGN